MSRKAWARSSSITDRVLSWHASVCCTSSGSPSDTPAGDSACQDVWFRCLKLRSALPCLTPSFRPLQSLRHLLLPLGRAPMLNNSVTSPTSFALVTVPAPSVRTFHGTTTPPLKVFLSLNFSPLRNKEFQLGPMWDSL